MTRALRLLPIGLVGLSLLAIVVQDFTDRLPLGLFNEGRGVYRLLSGACLGLAGAALGVLVVELATGRLRAPAGYARRLLFSLIFLELLLRGADPWIASGPRAPWGGPYTERRTRSGDWVFLMKEHPGSPLGFRADRPQARLADRPRLLFLGDSYTYGTGRGSACNYPTVVADALREAFGLDVEAMNAGVPGYGPRDALNLLQLLRDEGYRFDAIVHTLFLGNDLTDNLPGTTRRVVAGINARFPEAAWLRWAHPLDSFGFRYLLLLYQFGLERRRAPGLLETGPCQLEPVPIPEPSPHLRRLVRDGLDDGARALASPLAVGEASGAIAALRDVAAGLGVPFFVVVFPDRIQVDSGLRERLAVDEAGLAALETLQAVTLREIAGPAIDVSPALRSQAGLYLANDTHLSDLGNVVAGRFVAERLGPWLRASGFPTDLPRSGP